MKITDLQKKYNLAKDDSWELKRGGKSALILTHDACEKIAYKEGIEFIKPSYTDIHRDNDGGVAIIGSAKLGDSEVWTVGEASPKNCKMPYNWAMAEKRLKDRLTLKLINAYEYGVYSEVEADDFNKPKKATEKQKNLIMGLESQLDGKLKKHADFSTLTIGGASDYIENLKIKVKEYEKELYER